MIMKGPEPVPYLFKIDLVSTQIFIIVLLTAGARQTDTQGRKEIGPDAHLLVRPV